VAYREFHYHWEYDLKSSPEKLWPFVSDTNRFNRDTGVPEIKVLDQERQLSNARHLVQLSVWGMPVAWEEQPFEWVRPFRFGVKRVYHKGPVAELRALVELGPKTDGGTRLTYDVWLRPKSWLGALAVPLQVGVISARRFARVFKRYDQLALTETPGVVADATSTLSPLAKSRLMSLRAKLLSEGSDPQTVAALLAFIEHGDAVSLARIRPYVLADNEKLARRAMLETCLRATRIGLLDLRWDLLCPLCRGAKVSGASLREINSQVHCETCRIDFSVNFERYVELTFRPNISVRPANNREFCIGSPQRTPHVVAQQLLPSHSSRSVNLSLEEGHYRLRALEMKAEQSVLVHSQGQRSAAAKIVTPGWTNSDLTLAPQCSLELQNETDAEQLFILERMSWSDQAATAAEVTALQIFRDLFATEALRPGEQISVGTLTVLFTDLRNSTRLYREIGDATAFGRVMNHFDIVKRAIAEEDGALVKTIGDAVMAVFQRPAAALRAMLHAQQILATPPEGGMPFVLKAGMHAGPCIAVTLNDRLDYFGSTVNMAARLECLSTGNDVIISGSVYEDPEVRMFIHGPEVNLQALPFEMNLKGFDDERIELWRVGPKEVHSMAISDSQ